MGFYRKRLQHIRAFMATYSFLNMTKLLELLSQGCLFGVPSEASGISHVSMNWEQFSASVASYPMNSFAIPAVETR
jgi:hypothetical protein